MGRCEKKQAIVAVAALSAAVTAAVFMPNARAGKISFSDRGPCAHCVDGVCVPNRKNFGYYPTVWRQWPGDQPFVAPLEDAAPEVPADIGPLETPAPEDEESGRLAPPAAASEAEADQGEHATDAAPVPPADSEDRPPSLPSGPVELPPETPPETPLDDLDDLFPRDVSPGAATPNSPAVEGTTLPTTEPTGGPTGEPTDLPFELPANSPTGPNGQGKHEPRTEVRGPLDPPKRPSAVGWAKASLNASDAVAGQAVEPINGQPAVLPTQHVHRGLINPLRSGRQPAIAPPVRQASFTGGVVDGKVPTGIAGKVPAAAKDSRFHVNPLRNGPR